MGDTNNEKGIFRDKNESWLSTIFFNLIFRWLFRLICRAVNYFAREDPQEIR